MQKPAIAIVTGGASGLGRAVSEELATRGTYVIVADIDLPAAQSACSLICENGGRAEPAHVDVSSAEQIDKLVNDVVSQHGQLDYIFNNAGIAAVGELRDGSVGDFRRVVDVNLFGVVHGTMAAYRVMLRQGSGHIVNIASMVGLMATPILTAYSTTKWAIIGFTQSLRLEAAALGVKVSAACPAMIRTNFPDRMLYWNVRKEEYLRWLPWQNRMLTPAAAARSILRGVARNQEIIICPFSARVGWWVYRACPSIFTPLMRHILKGFRKLRVKS
jgi:NAD(P)-dependent dehydrogenase (short-subunit alcohol dehydrogenase family)